MSGRGTWPTIAPAYRSVDQLTGRIAELERQHQADEHRVADAEAQRDEARGLYEELRLIYAERTSEYAAAVDERDQARAERDTARALGSRRGW